MAELEKIEDLDESTPYILSAHNKKQGAEARISECVYLGRQAILKERFSKSYRHEILDKQLNKTRLRNEVKGIVKAKQLHVNTPAIFFVDGENNKIIMERILGVTAREWIESLRMGPNFRENTYSLGQLIGRQIARMHMGALIHGDLTTSNIIIRDTSSGEIVPVFVDFGLSMQGKITPEEKGVDLYVLERAILSTHICCEHVFAAVLDGYKDENEKNATSIIAKLDEIRLRGRKRDMMKRTASDNVDVSTKLSKQESRAKNLTPGIIILNKIQALPDQFNVNAKRFSEILEEIQPTNSIHFNFMIDFEWLINQYPARCRDTSITLVVGEKTGTTRTELKTRIGTRKNIKVAVAPLSIPFGTHHSKLSLFEDDTYYHVIVSTANLRPDDWEAKTQIIYYTRGTLLENDEEKEDNFKNDLFNYLGSYKMEEVKYWRERLKCFTFPKNGDRLVYSYPGYHKGDEMNKIGHLSLRSKLATVQRKKSFNSRLFVIQCSSIGSLGSSIHSWIEPQFLKSLKGGKEDGVGRTFVIYPTVQDVKESILGYASGCSLPYQLNTATKQPWLESIFCKWRCEPFGRSRIMPHCKTYTELLDGDPQWMIVTSANLSKAAWGEMQKNCTQLMVRSYEIGVLITDKERIFLPYNYPLQKYVKDDKPWIVDKEYLEKDCLGEQWRL